MRKSCYFGSIGENYFEQPSINLIQSGLWSCSDLRPRLVRVEAWSERLSASIDAIRLTFCTESRNQGGSRMTMARKWIGEP